MNDAGTLLDDYLESEESAERNHPPRDFTGHANFRTGQSAGSSGGVFLC